MWAVSATRGNAAEVAPGKVIGKNNAAEAEGLVSPGVMWAVRRGMEISVTEPQSIEPPPPYREATEKYSGQVRLTPEGLLEGWVAGRPFPTVDPNDPDAATKIMWNFERGSQIATDDLTIRWTEADTGAIDGEFNVERRFVIDAFRNLRYVGRTEVPPVPAMADNPDEVLFKVGQYPVVEPFDLKGTGGISFRYLDFKRQDDTWIYLPALRRVRRLSSSQRSDALFGQEIDIDSYGGYAGNPAWFKWRLLGRRRLLACLHSRNMPPKLCKADGGLTFCPEDWELRDLWIIEGTPKMSGYAYSKRILYIDTETYVVPYTDLYDRGGELWKVLIQYHRTDARPNPRAGYAAPFPRVYLHGFVAIDMQIMHATRGANPGWTHPDEPGWYINVGEKAGVKQKWFTLSALVKRGL